MAEVASAFVTIAPSAKGFGSKLNSEISGDLDSSGKSAGSKFGSALKVGALGVLGGAALLGGFLKGAVDEARDAQKVGALTNAVIKSTGGVANVTAKQVDALATSISNKTGVDDEAIAAGQNMLLTFGNVRNEVGKGNDIFSQATVAATDMAAAFGGDAVSNSKMLGKALNDPTKGVSALTRVGVSFTQQQKDQITTLQESGDMLGAQKIILGELSKQTAGAAASQATAGQKFSTIWGNFQESIGTALLPTIDKILTGMGKFVIFLTNDIGPGLAALNGFIAPVIANVKLLAAAFQGAFATGVSSSGSGPFALMTRIGAAVAGLVPTVRAALAQFVPVVQTMANTFITVVLPAVRSFVTYVASALIPIFRQVAGIVTGQVIPMIAALARFFYGTLYPAIIRVEVAIAKNLKPIFDALVKTISGSVLPAVNRILAKLREWGPTIGKVVTVVVKIVGALLTFAAAILGKVLPPVIRFAGFLLGNVVSAVLAVIGVVVKIIGKVVEFGTSLVKAVGKAGEFLSGVKAKIGAAFDFIKGIPGKVTAVFSGAATLLYNAGSQLMSGLAAGIRAKITDAINEVKAGLSKIKGLLPGSPIKWGPLKNWNQGGAGKRLMSLVEKGITAATPKTVKAAKSAFDKIAESLEATRDRLKGQLDSLKSDFEGIKDAVAGAFTGNLFDVSATLDDDGNVVKTVGQNFIASLMGKKAELSGLLASFKTLQGWGIDPGFLTQLFSSGNGALITELAGMGQGDALATAGLFGDVTNLSAELGTAVASNDAVADRIDETNRLLTIAVDQLSYLGSDIGQQLNQAASKAQRDKKNRGGKGKK